MRYCVQGALAAGRDWVTGSPRALQRFPQGQRLPDPPSPDLLMRFPTSVVPGNKHTPGSDSLPPPSSQGPRTGPAAPASAPTHAQPSLAHRAGRDTQSYSGNSRRFSRPASLHLRSPAPKAQPATPASAGTWSRARENQTPRLPLELSQPLHQQRPGGEHHPSSCRGLRPGEPSLPPP